MCQMQVIFQTKNQIEGATRVIEGVYTGGNVESYKNNPDFVVREYYGYAAWFGGQLDGELRRSRAAWTIENNVTFANIFTEDMVEASLESLRN